MSYSNFTFSKLKLKYGLEQREKVLFEDGMVQDIAPSQRLAVDLEEGKRTPLLTEKAKSESIIAPIMRELKRKNEHITIFSGYQLSIEGDADLSGNPDFIISAKPQIVEPQSPIFCLFESKNKAPEEGYAQCAAEMYAAKRFNEQMKNPQNIIYGAVTNAFDWVFMQLEEDTVWIDLERYYLNQLPRLLGIMNYIIHQYK